VKLVAYFTVSVLILLLVLVLHLTLIFCLNSKDIVLFEIKFSEIYKFIHYLSYLKRYSISITNLHFINKF